MLIVNQWSRAEVRNAVARLFQPPAQAVGDAGQVGVELEWIPARPGTRPPGTVGVPALEALFKADPSLMDEVRMTFEPGGQPESSPPPSPSVVDALATLDAISHRVSAAALSGGVELYVSGLNPWHTVDELGLQTPAPRYTTMQAHFDSVGAFGRQMMRQTAALQISLDLGTPEVALRRWRVANLAGPALAAAFANSPVHAGVVTGLTGTRSAIWQKVDPSRTGYSGRQVSWATLDDAIDAYTEFVSEADVIVMPEDSCPDPLTHHLSTLFPPVRPRGNLEIRYIDALPPRWRAVPIAVLVALLYEPQALDEAVDVLQLSVADQDTWRRSAERGLKDDTLRHLATQLLNVAIGGMDRLPASYLPRAVCELARDYRERFTLSGRCPADEQLERFIKDPEDLSTWT